MDMVNTVRYHRFRIMKISISLLISPMHSRYEVIMNYLLCKLIREIFFNLRGIGLIKKVSPISVKFLLHGFFGSWSSNPGSVFRNFHQKLVNRPPTAKTAIFKKCSDFNET
jgi:hypothetical protein